MNVRTVTIAVGLMLLGSSADAQENPNNFHSRHNADSVYNVDRQQRSPVQPPPRPSGYWEKTWGAIAPSPKGGVLGAAVGAKSKLDAESLALADCKAKGGADCQVQIAYQNQCAVMVLGDKVFNLSSAASIQEAATSGLQRCSKEDTNCRVYYSACTEPVFYHY